MNSTSTLTGIAPSTATDGTGLVTVTTTLTDVDGDSVTLYVDYSLDGGSTWSSSTIGTVSGDGSPTSTAAGQITSLTSLADGNDLTFTWDTQTDSVTVTTTAQVRIKAYDGIGYSSIETSSNFTVDNVAPDAPSAISVFVVNTTIVTSTWANVSGASTYTVSTTAGTATTTSATTTAYTSLSPNTQYSFQTLATDAYGNASSYSTASSTYTSSTPPTSLSASSDSTSGITVTWGAASNGTGTVYELYNVTDSEVVVTTTALTYSVTDLIASTEYTFKVRAENLGESGTYSSYSDTVSATTDSEAVATPDTSSSAAPAPTPPSAPSAVAPATTQVTATPGQTTSVAVGNVSHSVSVTTPAPDGSVQITIQSDPVTITLKQGEERLIDTDTDSVDDLFVRLDKVEENSVQLTLSAIEDLEFSINQALSTTDTKQVTLYLNSPDSVMVALSNTSDFLNISYQSYEPQIPFTLTPGNGEKTVYIKLRTAQGGTRVVSDTITLTNQPTDQTEEVDPSTDTGECLLTPKQAYKHPDSSSVYYITEDCTKRAFKDSNTFFTYFTSWNSVKTTNKTTLDSVSNDTLGFMPKGPLYNPKYGAIVKTVTDPKVYLLLNTEKYWITSPTVFNALNYAWDWIEDIAEDLLNKYTVASEIDYTDHHPNYTLVKYTSGPDIYLLEPNPQDPTKQVKRKILNEEVFESLGYRWDRVVTLEEDETYEDGEELDL